MAFFRLSEKISVSIFLMIIFFGSLATVSTFLLTKRILVEKAEEEFITIGPYRSYVASQLIRSYLNNTNSISSDPVVKDFLIDYEKDPKNSIIEDEELLSHDGNNSASAIYILNRQGVGIASTDKRLLNQDYSFRNYFKSSIAGNNFIDIALGVTTNEMGYYFSAPVKESNTGEVIGVVVYKLKPEVLSRELFGSVPFDFEFSLIDEYGVVILSTDSEKVYSSLSELSDESKNKIAEIKRYGNRKIYGLDYPELMILLPEASTNSSRLISLEDSVDKKKEATTLYKIEGTPFYLMVEQDTSFLNEVSLRSAAMVASFVAIAALASIVIISFIIKLFLAPLEKITTFAKQIGEGKAGEKILVKNNDEIGELGQVINEMSDQLSSYRDTMEMKVKERTAEIEKSMDLMLGREIKMMELKKENKKLKEGKENESAE